MIVLRLILALLPLLSSWFLISALLPKRALAFLNTPQRHLGFIIWRVTIASGMGLAASSVCLWFFLLQTSNSSLSDALPRLYITEIICFVVSFLCWLKLRHRVLDEPLCKESEQTDSITPTFYAPRLLIRALAATLCVCIVLSLTIFVSATAGRPWGELDAWSIWNLHARFIFRGGEEWRDFFSPTLIWSHPDYPLLVPLSVARGWSVTGGETKFVPIALGLFFAVATVTILMATLRTLRSSTQALIGGIVLLGTPFFALNSAAQTADGPLAFFFLASLSTWCYSVRALKCKTNFRFHVSLALISGSMAGFGAWTKNEGAPWLLILAIVSATLYLKRGQSRRAFIIAVFFVVAALPGLAAKIAVGFLAPPNDVLSTQSNLLQKIFDLSRWEEIAISFLVTSQTFGLWACPPAIFLWYYHRALGQCSRSAGADAKVNNRAFVILTFTALSYFVIFLITPHPLSWHLTNSLNRLMLQLWPSFLLLFFLQVPTPEEAIKNFQVSTKDN